MTKRGDATLIHVVLRELIDLLLKLGSRAATLIVDCTGV